MTPFGKPVVPEVYWIIAVSWGLTDAWRSRCCSTLIALPPSTISEKRIGRHADWPSNPAGAAPSRQTERRRGRRSLITCPLLSPGAVSVLTVSRKRDRGYGP